MIPPRVAVVVLQWNRAALTQRCLDSLAPSLTPMDHLYLVDNGSTDGAGEWLEQEAAKRGAVCLRHTENLGYAPGLKAAVQRALDDGSRWVLLLNNDVVCHVPGFLEQGLLRGEKARDFGIVGGKLTRWPDTGTLWSVGGEITWRSERFLGLDEPDRGQYARAELRTFVSGAMMLVRRELLAKIGLPSDAYAFGSEDREFCWRARNAGFRIVYEPRFVAAHEAGASHEALAPEWLYLDALGRMLFRKRNFGGLSFASWRAAYAWYLKFELEKRHARSPELFPKGISAAQLRTILGDALHDIGRVDRTSLAMLAEYRERAQRSLRQ